MADIKISELNETNSLSGFYVPGVMENDIGELTTRKFYINNFQDNINKAVNSIQNGVNPFNTSVNYYTGEYVTYGTSVYRFITDHPAGVWDISEVEEVSVYGELESMLNTNNETVHINISSSDDLLTVSNINVTVTYNNITENRYSDSSGNCTFNIPIGQSYTIHLDNQANYQSIGDSTYTAEIKDRYINIVYQRDISLDTCTVNVKINLPNGGNISDFNGLNCLLSGNTLTNPMSISINDGIATFSGNNIRKNIAYTTTIPSISGYSKPNNKTFKAYSDNTLVNFYYKSYTSGLFLLYLDSNNEYREVDLDALYTDPSDTTTWIGDSEYGITKDNALAIHVCTEELASINCDYFVRVEEFQNYPKYAMFSSNVGIPSQQTIGTNYDGKYNSCIIATEAVVEENLKIPALEYVFNRTFKYNGITLRGFIGTLYQYREITGYGSSNNVNRDKVKNVITSLEIPYTNPQTMCTSPARIPNTSVYSTDYYVYNGSLWTYYGDNTVARSFITLFAP